MPTGLRSLSNLRNDESRDNDGKDGRKRLNSRAEGSLRSQLGLQLDFKRRKDSSDKLLRRNTKWHIYLREPFLELSNSGKSL
jgi:hypothetical protein